MNSFRNDASYEYFRDGTQRGGQLYWYAQWTRASEGLDREGRHHSAVSAHPDNPNLHLTPHARRYFDDVLPTQMPKDSKVKTIVVATDLDAKFWQAEYSGPPSDAFNDITDPLYDTEGVHASTRLWSFFERSFVQRMRHMPRAFFFNEEFSTALIVLCAMESATYHLKQMAGIGCLPETGFEDSEVHDAFMRHEWFHLSKDQHLSDLGIEIGADDEAIGGIKTPSLKQAWIDARIVGGFMWPFPGRQNGIPLVDPNFRKTMKQEIQMNAVYEFCDRAFEKFYDPKIAAKMVSDIYDTLDIKGLTSDARLKYQGKSTLPDDMQRFFYDKFYNKLFNERVKLATPEEFKGWLCEHDDKKLAEQCWRYMTQAYMMRMQVSNMNQPEFYAEMQKLSEEISPQSASLPSTKGKVHHYFRQSLERLLPNLPQTASVFKPEWYPVELPSVDYPKGAYIGDQQMTFTLTTFSR
ncbi:MAG: hypothetical protein AAF988_08110 [Pseudomonadota bacterium]